MNGLSLQPDLHFLHAMGHLDSDWQTTATKNLHHCLIRRVNIGMEGVNPLCSSVSA